STTDLGNIIVDISPPTATIDSFEITTIEKNIAKVSVQYSYTDNISANPAEIGIHIYNFRDKQWKYEYTFKDIPPTGKVEIPLNLFTAFSLAISAKDFAGNQYISDEIKANRPTPYILNFKKPRPKLYSPIKNQIVLSGESLTIKWNCKERKSIVVSEVDIYITDKYKNKLTEVISGYPLKGEYLYFPILEKGEYYLTLVCKGKFRHEFSTTKRFFVIDKLPAVKIEPIRKP
ncbi:MAG: hypothetical protein ACK4NF_07525, partial [Planctomycetota bacterium]